VNGATVLQASWYSESLLESEKAKQLEMHMKRVAAHGPLSRKVTATLIDHTSPHDDGIEMEWVTEV
jgi:hypothetical protein